MPFFMYHGNANLSGRLFRVVFSLVLIHFYKWRDYGKKSEKLRLSDTDNHAKSFVRFLIQKYMNFLERFKREKN